MTSNNNTMEVSKDVVIVGAGIAGLATSLGLHRLGIGSLVLESSPTIRVTGFAFTTWTNAWKALDALGIGDFLRKQLTTIDGLVPISTITGQTDSEISFKAKGKIGKHEVRCMKRKLLLETLAQQLPTNTIKFSSKVVSIEEEGYFKVLHLIDGTTIKTKVLIGCDGVNSIVAKWLELKKPAFAGRLAMRGYANFTKNHGYSPKFQQFFGDGFRSGLLPCDDNIIYWFFTWTSSTPDQNQDDNPSKMKEFILSKFENESGSPMRIVVEATNVGDMVIAPLTYRQPWDLVWGNISKANVCVAGDALHPMTPDLGQGGCSALEDAVVLARCLGEALLNGGENEEKEEFERIEIWLKKYAQERRFRGIQLVTVSYLNGFIQQSNGKILNFLRDKLLANYLGGLVLKMADFDCGKLRSS